MLSSIVTDARGCIAHGQVCATSLRAILEAVEMRALATIRPAPSARCIADNVRA
jgi:hypothetical protein